MAVSVVLAAGLTCSMLSWFTLPFEPSVRLVPRVNSLPPVWVGTFRFFPM